LALFAAVASPQAFGADRPALRAVSTAPFKVHGERFEPKERVVLRLNVAGELFDRVVKTTRAGTFSAGFKTAPVGRCAPWIVTAHGSLGSRATLRRPVFVDCAQP
jgi:hypothetical protein